MQGWATAGKSWVALIGGVIISLLPIIPTVAGVLPLPWGPVLTGLGLILSAVAKKTAYHAPYAPVGIPAPPAPPAPPVGPATGAW